MLKHKVKIFGLGLSRSGTTSLTVTMQQFGFDSKSLPLRLDDFQEFAFLSDITVASRFEELDKKFPNSKFIYTVRDPEEWVKSVKLHFQRETRRLFISSLTYEEKEFLSDSLLNIYSTLEPGNLSEPILLECYKRHDLKVRSYFQDREEDLLILNICNSSSPLTNLVSFLEKNKFIGFPKLNSRQD